MLPLDRIGPRNLGELVEETFRILRQNFWRLLGIVALYEVPVVLFQIAIIGACFEFTEKDNILQGTEETTLQLAVSEGVLIVVLVAVGIIAFIGNMLMQGALIRAVGTQYIVHPFDVWTEYRASWRRLRRLLAASLMVLLVMVGVGVVIVLTAVFGLLALGIIVAVPIGLYLIIRLVFVYQAIMLDRYDSLGALARSWNLVKNNWWRVFGILLLMLIGILIVQIAITIPTGPIIQAAGDGFVGFVVQSIFGLVFVPISLIPFILVSLLYLDLRARKEGLSIDELEADLRIMDDYNIPKQSENPYGGVN